jgi:hypothetical protein
MPRPLGNQIVWPEYICRMFGWPGSVFVTATERKAIERIHSGYSGPIAHRTANSLTQKGLLETTGGLTIMGKRAAEALLGV